MTKIPEIKKTLDDIKKLTVNSSNPKIKRYIEMFEEITDKTHIKSIIELKKNLELERKSISTTLKDNFPLFIKYDNIYREMISAAEFIIFILKKRKKGVI
ncbi:MAG: hypothetical protein ACP5IO_05075 [Elusimicrobiales bacterium]